MTSKTAAACSTVIFLCLVFVPFPREFTEKINREVVPKGFGGTAKIPPPMNSSNGTSSGESCSARSFIRSSVMNASSVMTSTRRCGSVSLRWLTVWKLTGWVVCVSDELKAPQGLELLSAGCRHPLLGNVLDSQGKYRLGE